MLRKTLVILVAAILSPAGCVWSESAQTRTAAPAPPPTVRPAPEAAYYPVAKPAGETPLPTAVENTLVLQEKYARSLEDLQRDRERNRELCDEKQKLIDTLNKSQADMAKAQQELNDANNLLVQMRQELEKWKVDVMGFRDEMRQAQKTQLDAIAKMMNLLGAEVGAGQGQTASATPGETDTLPPVPAPVSPLPGPTAQPDAKKPAASKTTPSPVRPAMSVQQPSAKDIARANSH